jgi:hypothetical protein
MSGLVRWFTVMPFYGLPWFVVSWKQESYENILDPTKVMRNHPVCSESMLWGVEEKKNVQLTDEVKSQAGTGQTIDRSSAYLTPPPPSTPLSLLLLQLILHTVPFPGLLHPSKTMTALSMPPPPPKWVVDLKNGLPTKGKNASSIPDPPGYSSAKSLSAKQVSTRSFLKTTS